MPLNEKDYCYSKRIQWFTITRSDKWWIIATFLSTCFATPQLHVHAPQIKSTNSLLGFCVGTEEEEVVMVVLVKLTVASAGYHKHTVLSWHTKYNQQHVHRDTLCSAWLSTVSTSITIMNTLYLADSWNRQCFHSNQKNACRCTFKSCPNTSCHFTSINKDTVEMYKTYQNVLNTYWYCLLTEQARQLLKQHNSFTSSMSKLQTVTMNLSSAIRKMDWLITQQLMWSTCDCQYNSGRIGR